jgi:ribosomal protein S18 acetylase RimI-like enzyme
MIDVRPMQRSDLAVVVAIHRTAFPNFFLSFLGPRFLHVFYGFVADEGIALVALDDGQLAGFVAGVPDSRSFYRRLLRHRVAQIALAILPVVLRRPSTLGRVVRRARQRTSAGGDEASGAELMSLAVDPSRQHSGIGRALIAAFAERVAIAGVGRLWLTTDAAENDRVIRFYESQGFQRWRDFTTAEGRALVELTRSAEPRP